jgi:hypothetical protein
LSAFVKQRTYQLRRARRIPGGAELARKTAERALFTPFPKPNCGFAIGVVRTRISHGSWSCHQIACSPNPTAGPLSECGNCSFFPTPRASQIMSWAKLDSAPKNRILCRFMKRSARWSPPTSGRLTCLAPANPEAGSTSPVVRCATKSQIATIHKTSNFMQLYEKTNREPETGLCEKIECLLRLTAAGLGMPRAFL